MKTTIVILLFFLSLSWIAIFTLSAKIMNSKIRIDSYKRRLRNMTCMYKEVSYLLQKPQNKSSNNEIKEAVRFAMVQAHPDNQNGDIEKFLKFKNIYDSL